jgi:hypothetical protein
MDILGGEKGGCLDLRCYAGTDLYTVEGVSYVPGELGTLYIRNHEGTRQLTSLSNCP